MISDLEREFISDNVNNGRLTVICSRQGGGKTHLFLSYLKLAFTYKLYGAYHLLIPEFFDEKDNKYEFIKYFPNVYVYDRYSEDIIQRVAEDSKKVKTMFVMEDATNYLFSSKNQDKLIELVSLCRHGKSVTLMILTHAMKAILAPSVRGMINHLFFGSFTNENIIRNHLYKENFSIFFSFNEFIEIYKDKVLNAPEKKPNFLYINLKNHLDTDVNKWSIVQVRSIQHPSKEQAKLIKINKNIKLVQRAKSQLEYKQIKEQYEPKKEIKKKFLPFVKKIPKNSIVI